MARAGFYGGTLMSDEGAAEMRRMTLGRVIAWIVIAGLLLLLVSAVGYMLMGTPAEPMSYAASLLG